MLVKYLGRELRTEGGVKQPHPSTFSDGTAAASDPARSRSRLPRVPLRKRAPEEFERLTETYSALLDLAVTARTYDVRTPVSPRLRVMAEDLGVLDAHPRDLIDVHQAAFRRMHRALALGKGEVLLEESRLVLLEVMGELVVYYRNRLEAPQ